MKERSAAAWRLAAAQHGVVTRGQLLKLGFSREAIAHRLACGRLHRLHAGVYAVGRPEVSEQGQLMAAVLACGDDAVLSHSSAAGLMSIGRKPSGLIEVSIRTPSPVRRPGLVVHRRPTLRREHTGAFEGIPVTSPVQTLIDIAPRLDRLGVERAVNEADKYDLVNPPQLRRALAAHRGEPGVARLRTILDRRTFRLTREELERRFLPLAREAGLPVPQTRRIVNGFEVDFFWPALGFVVETDGLRYHRTPAEQARDRLRDQAHTAAGYAHLRFTHEQVRYEPEHVRATLVATARLLPAPVARSAAVGPAAGPA
ncbi:MAG TPA: type IV toxin-antitoxin system AbiEi family antitoxin domain-containing protein [Solirubrobacterales bacterium]